MTTFLRKNTKCVDSTLHYLALVVRDRSCCINWLVENSTVHGQILRKLETGATVRRRRVFSDAAHPRGLSGGPDDLGPPPPRGPAGQRHVPRRRVRGGPALPLRPAAAGRGRRGEGGVGVGGLVGERGRRRRRVLGAHAQHELPAHERLRDHRLEPGLASFLNPRKYLSDKRTESPVTHTRAAHFCRKLIPFPSVNAIPPPILNLKIIGNYNIDTRGPRFLRNHR